MKRPKTADEPLTRDNVLQCCAEHMKTQLLPKWNLKESEAAEYFPLMEYIAIVLITVHESPGTPKPFEAPFADKKWVVLFKWFKPQAIIQCLTGKAVPNDVSSCSWLCGLFRVHFLFSRP